MRPTIDTLLSVTTSNGMLDSFLKEQGQNILNDVLQWLAGLPWWVWVIVAVVVLAIVASFVKPVATIIVWAFKIVFWILSAPFKLIGLLFGRDKK